MRPISKSLLRAAALSTFLLCESSVYAQSPCLPPVFGCATSPANLVSNGDFESYSACPNNLGQLYLAVPWFQPSGGSPDYFNSCGNTIGNFGSIVPHSGNGYAGGFEYNYTIGNIAPGLLGREYLEAPLISPLQAGVTYGVSFYVSLASSAGFAIDSMGAYLSTGPLEDFALTGPFNVVPQVQNLSGVYLDTVGSWMCVSGTYTAVGGEDYLTIGNFKGDLQTLVTPSSSPNGGLDNSTYYYFDDVSVSNTCGCQPDKTVDSTWAWTFDTPTAYDPLTDAASEVTVLSTVTNGNCPLNITRTWVATNLCGSTTCEQTVTVRDIPQILCTNTTIWSCVPTQVFYSPTVVDPCCSNVVATCIPPSGSVFGVGATTVLCTATNCFGNVAVATFTVTVVSAVVSQTNIEITSCTNLPVYYSPTVEECCSNWNLTLSPTSGSTFDAGKIKTVDYTLTDSCGGEISGTFTVAVVPCTTNSTNCLQLQCPSDISATTCSNCAEVNFSASVTDLCCSNVKVSYVLGGLPIGTNYCFPLGVSTVQVTATDGCHNQANCSFNVTVLQDSDFQVQSPTNVSVFSCTNVAVFYPNLTVSNLCCTNRVVFNPTNGSSFAPGTGSLVTWSVYDCSGTNVLSSGTFWVSVFCTNCCSCTNYTNYTVAVFRGSNYLGDWLCQGTNNTLADVLPGVPAQTEVYFWNQTLQQFMSPPDTFSSGHWQSGTEPLFPGQGFLLVSPTNTNLTIYGCLPGCGGGCSTLACSTTLFLGGAGLSPIPFSNVVCGTIPNGTEVLEPPNGGGTSAGLATYAYFGSWSPGLPAPLQVGYAEFIVTPPCPTSPIPTWGNGGSGAWSSASNWMNNLIPNGTGIIVDFSELTLWTNFTVTLDISVTVGGLIFGDQGNLYNWTLANGGAGPLTLNDGTNTPVITVENQTATITAVIAGTNGLSKSGAGTLTLAGANTYSGPTTVNAGTLQLDQPSLAAGSTLSVASGGSLNLNFAGTNTIAGLVLNGVSQPPGIYNSIASPGYLTGSGSLLVAAATATSPTAIVASVSSGYLNLSWPADHTGWRLLVQTNHLASGVSANTNDWSTVSGSTSTNQVRLPILPTQPAEFYRLVYP